MMDKDMNAFDGQVAMVTGGSSGLGACLVAKLRAAGARVYHCGLPDPSDGAAGAEPAGAEPAGDPDYERLDVRDAAALGRFVDRVAAAHDGRLDLAVNAAGISHASARVADLPPETFAAVMATNAGGVFHALHHQVRVMAPRGRGAIVNVASILSRRGAPWVAAYGASKHAVVGLTQSAAAEYGPLGLRINAVSPGPMDTPMFQRAMADIGDDLSKYAGGLPAGGPADPATVAELILFVLSPGGAYLNGANLIADGGTTAA
ncbi:SDR family NAD(P)-dependent oxidoreductase [Rhodothalassium salexigens]|uniref:SDR family NAD(P)-dependent oxidoreductase n=1 Tax=Rhodothalassium salexigens TaxID=1086 RepID=UPI001911DBA7|nr:SDR family oxidoreductase [Rhodothalassium salexigens]